MGQPSSVLTNTHQQDEECTLLQEIAVAACSLTWLLQAAEALLLPVLGCRRRAHMAWRAAEGFCMLHTGGFDMPSRGLYMDESSNPCTGDVGLHPQSCCNLAGNSQHLNTQSYATVQEKTGEIYLGFYSPNQTSLFPFLEKVPSTLVCTGYMACSGSNLGLRSWPP